MNISEVKKGAKLLIGGAPFTVVDLEFVKPGKGQGLYRCRLRNLSDGAILDRTYRSDDSVDEADISEAQMQFLYIDGNQYWFMDTNNFEQVVLDKNQISEARNYLQEEGVVTVLLHDGKPIAVTPPNFIDLTVTETEAALKGATKDSGAKPATVETGLTLTIPSFVEEGEIIRIDTRTGTYVERVRKQ
jgi:elongation factor P